MSLSPLKQFVLAAVLWLPACFFLWFVLGGAVIWPATALADLLLPALLPQAIDDLLLLGTTLEVQTRLLTEVGAGRVGALVLEVRPLIYAWCLPLFAGLVLATPLGGRDRLRQLAIGLPVLWLVTAWGCCFDALKLLAFDAGPLGRAAIEQAGFSLDAVALGYQFGYLILPAVTPIVLWVLMNRLFLEELVGWQREPNPASGGLNDVDAGTRPAGRE